MITTEEKTKPELTKAQKAVIEEYRDYVKDFKIRIKAAEVLRRLEKFRNKESEEGFKESKRPGWAARFEKAETEANDMAKTHLEVFVQIKKDASDFHCYKTVKHGMTWGLRAHITTLLEKRFFAKRAFKEFLEKEGL